MTSRTTRKAIAKQTQTICSNGYYMVADRRGKHRVNIAAEVESAVKGTQTYSPEDLEQLKISPTSRTQDTEFRVKNATTFQTAREILDQAPNARVLCLNFASAKNPGGGFLNGSQAQEEALCRGSALYDCIDPHQEYYNVNRKCGTCLYTDYMIYSPMVPVFRDDDDQLILDPYCVSVVTAPAVNKGAVAKSKPGQLSRVPDVMSNRIALLLSLAATKGYQHLVLGAWGCGVFRNDPKDIARQFHDHLCGEGKFTGLFSSVHFGVLDFSQAKRTYRAFDDQFRMETIQSR